jgi:hypothetical protein
MLIKYNINALIFDYIFINIMLVFILQKEM